MLAWLLELVFPARCIGCGVRGTPLCTTCRTELPQLPDGVCQRCASARAARGACRGCRQLSPAVSTVRAAFAYEGAARSAVLTLKFRSGRYLAPTMGQFLRDEVVRRRVQADVIVPVPLSIMRLRERGFNQARLLAEQVSDVVGAEVIDALSREERPAQRTLGASERLTNLEGAFTCVKAQEIGGRRVLLVDDVVTTGATVSACADTLARAGARRVSALVFARAI